MMLSHATIIGRSHRLKQQNCQDFAVARSPQPGITFGLVADGCGSKYRDDQCTWPSQNEVGAQMLAQFTADFLSNQLSATGTQHSVDNQFLDRLLGTLYEATLRFLRGLVALYPEEDVAYRQRFIATKLLCTLVGFVAAPETAVFFWRGDGHLCVNGRVITLDNHNRPDYLAYQLLANGSAGFQTCHLLHPQQIEWMAVATDGWHEVQLREQATPRHRLALQRWVNLQARQRHNFDDDGAIAIYYRD